MRAGIAPNSVTLAALLLVVTEAAEVSKVPLELVAKTLLQIDAIEDATDEAPEQKISWPVN